MSVTASDRGQVGPYERLRGGARSALDGHVPEDAVVLHPLRAFDERADREPVGAGNLRRDHAELEPGDLIRAHPRRRLGRDAVVAGPAGRGRSIAAVAAECRRAILARIGVPRSEVRDLAYFS